MRPRVFPAEDPQGLCAGVHGARRASMRPRVFPAEDTVRGRQREAELQRFNEAAGIPRGRRMMECAVVDGGPRSLQ